MPERAFAKDRYALALRGGRALALEAPDLASAGAVADAMCRIDPWLTLKARPGAMRDYLTGDDAQCCRLVLRLDGALSGVVAVRNPWLYGPYLALLAVLPAHQRLGIGSAILDWMTDEAGAGARNLWVCASEFNRRAVAFYERHGFQRVGAIADLVAPDTTELLLRKRLAR
jgi:ribosomal protein S18 acetylase RimI-like enzyme